MNLTKFLRTSVTHLKRIRNIDFSYFFEYRKVLLPEMDDACSCFVTSIACTQIDDSLEFIFPNSCEGKLAVLEINMNINDILEYNSQFISYGETEYLNSNWVGLQVATVINSKATFQYTPIATALVTCYALIEEDKCIRLTR